MGKERKVQIGELPPKYNFIINPYPYKRLSSCPLCDHRTGQRKLPLLIHVDPGQLIVLNYTCRYCRACDLLMAQKHEIEHHLYNTFLKLNPDCIGNFYLVFGTAEKKAWREGLKEPKPPLEMFKHASDFKTVYEELRHRREGWYPKDLERPIVEPPASKEWVKREALE